MIKLLEENIGRTFSDINQSNTFFDPYPRIMKTKAKINKWDLLKLKSFLHSKGNKKQNKRQPPTDWDKIFATDATNKGLVPKIYKQFMTLHKLIASNFIPSKQTTHSRNGQT